MDNELKYALCIMGKSGTSKMYQCTVNYLHLIENMFSAEYLVMSPVLCPPAKIQKNVTNNGHK